MAELVERVAVRFLIPTASVAGVIGKGGEHIAAIRARSGARIDIDDTPIGEERPVLVSGGADACETAIRAVWALVQSFEAARARGNPYVALAADGQALALQSFRLLVPAAQAGSVIGKGGSEIHAIRDATSVRIEVQSSAEARDGPERIVTLQGSEAQVHAARRLVVIRLQAAARGRHGTVGSEALRGSAAVAGDAGGSSVAWRGGGEGSGGDSGGLSSLSGVPLAPAGAPLVSECLAVPPTLVGRLIGRAGSSITRIREASGCMIHVEEEDLPLDGASDQHLLACGAGLTASTVRPVHVVGTPDRIAFARILIAECLATGTVPDAPAPAPAGPGSRVVASAGPRPTAVPGFVRAGHRAPSFVR